MLQEQYPSTLRTMDATTTRSVTEQAMDKVPKISEIKDPATPDARQLPRDCGGGAIEQKLLRKHFTESL